MRRWLTLLFLLLSLAQSGLAQSCVETLLHPQDGLYARAIHIKYAQAIVDGLRPLGPEGEYGEAFITAYEDLQDLENPKQLATRLSLFVDEEATIYRDTSEYVLIVFRFKGDPNLFARPPNREEGFGFVPGGFTAGGAREWVVDYDANIRGQITLLSVERIH